MEYKTPKRGKSNTICPILWKKMLSVGNIEFNKQYNGVLVDCKTCDMNTCNKIKGE